MLYKKRGAARDEVLGMWSGRTLPMGVSKQGSAPSQGKSTAKGSEECGSKGKSKERMALEGEESS